MKINKPILEQWYKFFRMSLLEFELNQLKSNGFRDVDPQNLSSKELVNNIQTMMSIVWSNRQEEEFINRELVS